MRNILTSIMIATIGSNEIILDDSTNDDSVLVLILKIVITLISIVISPFIAPLVEHFTEYLRQRRKKLSNKSKT